MTTQTLTQARPDLTADLAPAPEWLCDETQAKSAASYEGTVKDWYETLEAGEPNVLVRRAIEDAERMYTERGDDFSHSDVIELQHRAIRLGAEGNPGIPALLDRIEEMFMSRTGAHSRPEEEWAHEFAEGLASGIAKHGDAISLRKTLPAYSLKNVPTEIPDRLVTGSAGNKNTFRELLATAAPLISDDMELLSLLWNAPTTTDLSHEWGLGFVHKRITDFRDQPEPVRENPSLPAKTAEPERQNNTESGIVAPVQKTSSRGTFLTAAEQATVDSAYTFIDAYMDASESKGFYTREYAIPAAWTALSMAMGTKAFIPKGVNIQMNLWFLGLGYSGTGKSAEFKFLKDVLDIVVKDEDSYYNLGAHSSPEALHKELLLRDGKASMIFHDEASSFFSSMKSKDWMRILEYLFSDWYQGDVEPSNKVRLKELRGKSAKTSFNIHMIATPDRLLELVDTEMFATGFLARFNWFWAPEPVDSDLLYESTLTEAGKGGINPRIFELSANLQAARSLNDHSVAMGASPEAMTRLKDAFKAFDMAVKKHERYRVIEPAIKRLGRETLWKCAALLALYEGRTTIEIRDALIAIHYASTWHYDLIRVVEATSESEFSRDVAEIEAYIRAEGTVSKPRVLHRFRTMIHYSPRELEDRLEFLINSGRVLVDRAENRQFLKINE